MGINKKFLIITIIILTSLAFSACSTTPVCITSSTDPLGKDMEYQNLGETTGSDSTWSILGLWMVGRPDIDNALKDALYRKQGDILINVRCYEKTTWYILFSITTVIIEGDAVKLKAREKKEIKEIKGKKK